LSNLQIKHIQGGITLPILKRKHNKTKRLSVEELSQAQTDLIALMSSIITDPQVREKAWQYQRQVSRLTEADLRTIFDV